MVLNEFVAYSQLGPLQGVARSAVVHDRDVRAVRLRELQLDRHPDRRHRRAGARPAARPGAPRLPRDAGRHAGQLHDGDDCGVPAVSRSTIRRPRSQARRPTFVTRPRSAAARAGRSPIVLGSGLGDFAIARRRRAPVDPLRRASRTGRRRASIGHAGQAGRRARCAGRRSRCCRAARTSTRGTPLATVDVRASRVLGAARREDADPHQRGRRHQHVVRVRAR